MGTGPLSHGRTNDKDRRDTHRNSHQDPAENRIRKEMRHRIGGIEEKDSGHARRDHEDGEFDGFENIEAPVAFERASGRSFRNFWIGFAD
jgi:hypothetical protein